MPQDQTQLPIPKSDEPSNDDSQIEASRIEARTHELAHELVHELTLQRRVYSGPIPPAEALAAYSVIDPSLPDRIMRMAEAEQAHRHKQDSRLTSFFSRGQWFGVTLGLGALLIAAYAIHEQLPWVAGTALTSIASIVGALIWQKRGQAKPNPKKEANTSHDS